MRPMVGVELVGDVSQVVTAFVFASSALRKAAPGRSLQPTLVQLGFRSGVARPAAYSVVTLEAAASAGLIIAPGSAFPYFLVAALATSFAVAGAVALARGRHIDCGCFGAGQRRPLGWWQIAAWPIWLGLCALAWVWVRPWSPQVGLGVLCWLGSLLSLFCAPGRQ